MPSGDGLLARVKPFCGRLPAAALLAVADAAEAHGNGVIELTSRGNLQIRGLTAASAPLFAAAMLDARLADPNPEREWRRNVITMPPYDDRLAAEIEEILANIAGLAPKFCVAIGQAEADIVVAPGEYTMTAAGMTVSYTPAALLGTVIKAAGRRLPRSGAVGVPSGNDLLFLRYGQTNPTMLRQLAGVTNEARTTPYRAFYVPNAHALTIGAAPRITACPGAPACTSGTTPTRDDADFLASRGIEDLHLSGCVKGCAYPRPARTLVARDGRYDLIRHGRAGDAPDVTGLTIAQAAALL